jgi:hypothetical protein
VELGITLSESGPAEIALFDLQGRRLMRRSLRRPVAPYIIPHEGDALTPGLYLIRVTQGPRSATIKVAVLR